MRRSMHRAALLTVALLPLLAGCGFLRDVADRGNRVTEVPGMRPAKFSAMVGFAAGSLVGLPITVILLPTYPFESLTYPSSPQHDISMPILQAPVEIAGGIGAFLLYLPFYPLKPTLGLPDGPSDLPPRDLGKPAVVQAEAVPQQ